VARPGRRRFVRSRETRTQHQLDRARIGHGSPGAFAGRRTPLTGARYPTEGDFIATAVAPRPSSHSSARISAMLDATRAVPARVGRPVGRAVSGVSERPIECVPAERPELVAAILKPQDDRRRVLSPDAAPRHGRRWRGVDAHGARHTLRVTVSSLAADRRCALVFGQRAAA
jgi:hypothetical protein